MSFKSENDIKVSSWMLIWILSLIPVVNIVTWVVLMFSPIRSKRNFAMAALVWFFIIILLCVVSYVIICLVPGWYDAVHAWFAAHDIQILPKLM